MNTVERGRIAAARVSASLVDQGWEIYLPAFDNGSCDLIALHDGLIQKVEIKYASRTVKSGSVEVSLRQTRHNMTGYRINHFDANLSDVLAVYFAPFDRIAFYSAAELDKRCSLTQSIKEIEAHARIVKPKAGDGICLENRRGL